MSHHPLLASLLAVSLIASPAVVADKGQGKDKSEHHQKDKKEKSDKQGSAKQAAVDKLVAELGLKNRGQLHALLGSLNSKDITTIKASDVPASKLKKKLASGDDSDETAAQVRKLSNAATVLLSKKPATTAEIAQSVTDILELLEE